MTADANRFVLSRRSSDNRIFSPSASQPFAFYSMSAFCLSACQRFRLLSFRFQRFSCQLFRFFGFEKIKRAASEHLGLTPAVHGNIVPAKVQLPGAERTVRLDPVFQDADNDCVKLSR